METSIVILANENIRKRLLENLVRPQTRIMIVTPFLQDVDMGNNRTLRTFLEQQIKADTEIELFTMPPPLKRGAEFRRKYNLLETYSRIGTRVFLNNNLHAKVFCFNNDDSMLITMLGSANLTSKGLYESLEVAMFSARQAVYHSVMANLRMFLRDKDTTDFLAWQLKNWSMIKAFLGGNK